MGLNGRIAKIYASGDREAMAHHILNLIGVDGGPGSGNFGHKGRPGKVGGSSEEGGKSQSSVSYSAYKAIFGSGFGKMKGALEKNGANFLPESPTDNEWKNAEEQAIEKGRAESLYGEYFSNKVIETNWYDQIKNRKFDNLTDEEAKFVLDLQDKAKGDDELEKEYDMLYSDSTTEEEKKAYMSLMSKATDGGYSQGIIDRFVKKVNGKINSPKEPPLTKNTEEYKAKIKEITDKHQNGEPYSSEEIALSGRLTMEEHERLLKDFENSEEYVVAKKARSEAGDKVFEIYNHCKLERDILRKLTPGTIEYNEQNQLVKSIEKAQKKYEKIRDEAKRKVDEMEKRKAATCLAKALRSIREVGIDHDELKQYVTNGGVPEKIHESFVTMINMLPAKWIRSSMEKGKLNLMMADPWEKRESHIGGASGSTISLKRNTSDDVLIHEFVHRLQQTEPELHRVEKEFYERRTKGEQEEYLYKIKPGYGYSRDEMTKKDNFPDPYCGKVYDDDDKCFEVLTVGMQWLYSMPNNFKKDKEYKELVYGALAVL